MDNPTGARNGCAMVAVLAGASLAFSYALAFNYVFSAIPTPRDGLHLFVFSDTGLPAAGDAPFPDPANAVVMIHTKDEVATEAKAAGGYPPLTPTCHPECSCEEISLHWGAFHDAMDFFSTPKDMITRWLKLGCKTNPAAVTERPTLPPFIRSRPAVPKLGVCYLVKVRGNNPNRDKTEAAGGRGLTMAGWGPTAANRTWFVEDGFINGTGSTVDPATMTIRLAIPHPTGAMDVSLTLKTMALFDFLSLTYDTYWGELGCDWFAHVDDDTWVNTALVERRLGCLDPSEEMYAGYHVGVAFGGFYIMSARILRQTAWFQHNWWKRRRGYNLTVRMEDFNWGHLLKMHGIVVTSFLHIEHYRLDPGQCKNKTIPGGYNTSCALNWVDRQFYAPGATDPVAHGAFPQYIHPNSNGTSRCIVFLHGLKTIEAMAAAHGAMTELIAASPPVDYRTRNYRGKGGVEVADPLCVAGVASWGGSNELEPRFRACAREAFKRRRKEASGIGRWMA